VKRFNDWNYRRHPIFGPACVAAECPYLLRTQNIFGLFEWAIFLCFAAKLPQTKPAGCRDAD
jgi:hypothetical protein